MQLPDDPNSSFWSLFSWFKVLSYAAFAALGGVIGHIMRAFDKQEKIVLGRAIVEGVGAGFVGLLVLFACQALNLSEQWTGVTVGLSGWLGANATIKVLESLVYKKLGLSKTPPKRKE